MELKLKIASGPLQGREFPLRAGAVIGRSSSDITINDPKVSGRHAKVEVGPTGDLILVDLGSNNGIRVNNKKLVQITLIPGLTMQIGSTICEILASREEKASAPMPQLVELEGADTRPPKIMKSPSWSEYFSNFIEKSLAKITNRPFEVRPFKPLVVLTITHGLHAGTKWTLGYGPRVFGIGSLDFQIYDPDMPPDIFKIKPTGEFATYETNYPDKVRLNGRSITTEKLKMDDEITFSNTRIKVSFK
ncbi:MAG: FHA domain-containing protein [Bdellovibrionales bacterium]|nr:FHA domain-containing protein [Bdellovibrionales bacterium]